MDFTIDLKLILLFVGNAWIASSTEWYTAEKYYPNCKLYLLKYTWIMWDESYKTPENNKSKNEVLIQLRKHCSLKTTVEIHENKKVGNVYTAIRLADR